jgi:ketosteroid isomerase-like protein
MKTLKTILGSIALLLIVITSNATAKPVNQKQTMDDVVKTYVDAVTSGKVSELDKVLSDDMQFSMQRGERVNFIGKSQFVDAVKNTPVDASVTTTTTVLQGDDSQSIVKVSFKYADYTRTDEITLNNSNGWTISKVMSSMK